MSVPAKTWEPAPGGQTVDVDEAFVYCEKLASSHYENFPVGSRLVPKTKRRYVYAIYAFARIADDFADEQYEADLSEADRLAALTDWERQLDECLTGRASHPIFLALATAIHDLQLPSSPFRDLLSAFRQDVVKRRYSSFSEILDYCSRSANPIGRLVLLLFGYRESELHALSDRICTALQLINFWQDVPVDIAKDRIYLPLDEMAQFGVTEDDLRARRFTPAYASLLSYQVERTRRMLADGRLLPEGVSGRLRYELRLTWLGGMRILERIAAIGFDTLNARPTITNVDKAGLLVRALLNRL